ncbi:MAG: hypothetical protein H6733_15860 [Alphaproteobacteria bacterium]|nr:hypothetical protein [Alphaproteobacteria bacterium]
MSRPDIKPRRTLRKPKDKAPTPDERASRKRIEELTASGMPFHLAQAVAQARMPLNEALERMAQRDEVERLMKAHELSRALATQVVLGHADLEAFLAKRRFEAHRAANLDKSVLEDARASGKPMVFCLFGQRKIEATVTACTPYNVELTPVGGEPAEELHKLAFKYAYAPDDWKKVKKAVRKHKDLSAAPREPATRPQDRYTCSDKRLFHFLDSKATVDATLLEGEILHGEIAWFSRFEFGMSLKGGGATTVFRHALHRIVEAK